MFRTTHRWLLICLATLTAGAVGAAEPTDPAATAEPPEGAPALQKVVVLDLAANGVDPALGKSLTQLLVIEIRETLPESQVSSQADVSAMLALEAQRQLVGCDADVGCLADIAGALGADHVVVGSVGRIGQRHLLEVRLIEAAAARTVRHLSAQVDGADERLADALAQLGPSLVDPARPTEQGWIDIDGHGPVRLDGRRVGEAPLRVTTTDGDHEITWLTHDGVPVRQQSVAVRSYESVAIRPGSDTFWDLGGLFASVGAGTAPSVDVGGLVGRAGAARGRLGWRFGSGFTLQVGRTLHSVHYSARDGGTTDYVNLQRLLSSDLALEGGTAGFGWSDSGRFRLHLSFDLGFGRMVGSATTAVTWKNPGPRHRTEQIDDFALFAQPSIEVAWVLARYLQLGVGLAYTTAVTGSYDLSGFSTTLNVGLPAGGEPSYPTDFFESPWFWTTAAVVIAGTSLMNDRIEALSFR